MKKVILLFVLSLFIMPLSAQFKANMTFNSIGQDRTFKVFYSELGYRYEFSESGQKGVILVKNGIPEIVILMPQQKIAMKGPADNPMSIGNDPLATYWHYCDKGTLKEEAKETVNKIPCTRSTLWNKDNPGQKMFTIWLSDKYSFPIKLVNHIDSAGDSYMELKDIEPWTPEAKSFEIPAGYQVMDMPKI